MLVWERDKKAKMGLTQRSPFSTKVCENVNLLDSTVDDKIDELNVGIVSRTAEFKVLSEQVASYRTLHAEIASTTM